MQTVDGLEELHMAGTRATFTLEEGASVDRAALAAAFEERGMKLESLGPVERAPYRGVVRIGAGVT